MLVENALVDLTPLIQQIQVENSGVTEQGVRMVMFDAIREFCRRSLAVRTESLETLAAGTHELQLPTDGNMKVIRVLNGRYEQTGRALEPSGVRPFPVVTGDPRRFYCPTPSSLVFDGMPQEPRHIRFVVAIEPIAMTSQMPAVLYDEYSDAIKWGTEGRLMTQKGKPYTDMAAGQGRLRRASSLAGEARVRAGAGNTTADPPWRYPVW